ncbi:Peptidase M23 [Desulfofarcimen acetoxidans DSM 771]|uniref:Peptidase M23 n=1 Tax=Desulfofarcimen acetoxidans (strain ATCC 49208 / DSM 771 / KCTC 5769 / VKM B-1644 / 5575) TaxID=485916 RepID=C8W5R1_DESAS|nr:M23 family metallopeptidase [Desulfofarcimen acetoxidans]ACV64061.1 Peptidase M23 [Desulfofarcimen acetoxidans DSM 771]
MKKIIYGFRNWLRRRRKPLYSSDDWGAYANLPQPGKSCAKKKTFGRRLFSRTVWAAVILLSILALRELPDPLGQKIKTDLRYLLTTEWDYQPVVQKVVQLGLRLANVDSNEITVPVFVPQKNSHGLPLPVSGRLVKNFGWVKDDLDGMERYHAGIDIATGEKALVQAVMDGAVKKSGKDACLGEYLLLEHNNGITTLYAQLQNISVKEGDQVKSGQVIGEAGTVGDIKGFGLHFEMREDKKLVDPLKKLQFSGQAW